MAWLGGPRAGKGAAHKVALCRVAAVVWDASIAGNAIGSGVEPSRSGGASSAMHSGHWAARAITKRVSAHSWKSASRSLPETKS